MILEPGRAMVYADGNCKLQLTSPIEIFAFVPHTHDRGIMVAGYKVSKGSITEIIRGDPKNPKMYYLPNSVRIDNGDYIHVRCTFDTTMDVETVYMGNFLNSFINRAQHQEDIYQIENTFTFQISFLL